MKAKLKPAQKLRHFSQPSSHRKGSNPEEVGVAGLGLMGKSIVACLLSSGYPVTGLDTNPERRRVAGKQILGMLREMRTEGLLKLDPLVAIRRFKVAEDYAAFSRCAIVLEAISEDLRAKTKALQQIEDVISPKALIASNTSAVPISNLQKRSAHPKRILGMHWAEPAHVTRFMEIICGALTSHASAERAVALARQWGKEPSLVQRDIRGFITNRISYAMFREAFHLVESGVATVADIDRSLRNDVGYWITFAGPFRYMDLMGIPPYAKVMVNLLPDLNCTKKVPPFMRRIVKSGAKGVSNCKGFYRYTPRQAKHWQELFLKFNYEIRKLALKYPEDAGDVPSRKEWKAARRFLKAKQEIQTRRRSSL